MRTSKSPRWPKSRASCWHPFPLVLSFDNQGHNPRHLVIRRRRLRQTAKFRIESTHGDVEHQINVIQQLAPGDRSRGTLRAAVLQVLAHFSQHEREDICTSRPKPKDAHAAALPWPLSQSITP